MKVNALVISIFLIVAGIFLSVTEKPNVTVKSVHVWTEQDSKAYAKDMVNSWAHRQYVCLASMWGKESAWKPTAVNPDKVMGKNAGGIPQLLGMSPTTPPTEQIDRGLDYIYHRYGTPCKAWAFHKKNGWY